MKKINRPEIHSSGTPHIGKYRSRAYAYSAGRNVRHLSVVKIMARLWMPPVLCLSVNQNLMSNAHSSDQSVMTVHWLRSRWIITWKFWLGLWWSKMCAFPLAGVCAPCRLSSYSKLSVCGSVGCRVWGLWLCTPRPWLIRGTWLPPWAYVKGGEICKMEG